MYGKGLLKGMKVTLGYHMKKKITKQYPEEKPDLAPRFRGSLEYDLDKCIACNACTRVCPNGVLELTTAKGADGKRKPATFAIDLQYCMFCAFCVEACPTNSLYFSPHFELACFNREQSKQVYQSPLVENAPAAEASDGVSSELAAAIVKKQEMVKKLASQMSALKKELKDEVLDETERQSKESRLVKLTNAFNKANQELKEMKAESEAAAPAIQELAAAKAEDVTNKVAG